MKKKYTTIMKQPLLLFTLLFGMFSTQAQEITFTFANAVITTDGINDFYETDIMIATDTDFIVGSGLLYFNYNTAAFGTNINNPDQDNGTDDSVVDVTFPDGEDYICAQKDNVIGSISIYGPFIQNDNTSSRFAFSFQQAFSSGSLAGNNITSTPTKLFHLKIQYIDSNIDPMVAFEGNSPFDDQFFTACGPGTFTSADCTNFPGTQITNDIFDSTNSTPATLGIETFTNLEASISVFPNPASDVINITSTENIDLVEVFNLLGKRVLKTNKTSQIKINNLSNGIYILKITIGKQIITKKIIKE